MSELVWINSHRFLLGALGLVVLLGLAVAGLWLFVWRSPGTPVSRAQAMDLYHQLQKRKPRINSGLPKPGIYRYRTSGTEALSVGGISRSFPSSTDMIVADGTCAQMMWEPLLQHNEGLVECRQANGALTIAGASSYEEIAGTQTTTIIRCPASTYLVPPDPSAGKSWNSVCTSGQERVEFSGEVVGSSSVKIHGQTTPAIHTRLKLSFSGAESGANPNDYWVSPSSGLILRQREEADISQTAGPLGSVRYTEQMDIVLASTIPLR